MVECLRRELLYSEKKPRDQLFLAIERLVADQAPMMVAQLTREAALAARAASARSGVAFDNWDMASKAVVKSMVMAGALLTPSGETIPIGVATQASLVGALCGGHRDRTEAFLLEFLIRQIGDITVRDHVALAHALFRQFDRQIRREVLEDRVVILLASLADRVVLSGQRYELREFQPA